MKLENNNLQQLISQPVKYSSTQPKTPQKDAPLKNTIDKQIKYSLGFLGVSTIAGIAMYCGRNNLAKLIVNYKESPKKTFEFLRNGSDDILQQAQELLQTKFSGQGIADIAKELSLDDLILYRNLVKDEELEYLDLIFVSKFLKNECGADLYINTMENYVNNALAKKNNLTIGQCQAGKALVIAYSQVGHKEKAITLCKRVIDDFSDKVDTGHFKKLFTNLTT